MARQFVRGTFAVLAFFAWAGPSAAQSSCCDQEASPITSPQSPDVADEFGKSIAMDGETMVIGEQGADGIVVNSGAAHVYTWDSGSSSWSFTGVTLIPVDAQSGDRIGGSVAISDDWFAVGSKGWQGSTGRALVYDRQTLQLSTIVAPDPVAGDEFGHAVAIDGDTLVVGAHTNSDQGTDAGQAYVYRLEQGTWTFVQTLAPPEVFYQNEFGFSVAVDGDVIVVGAPGETDPTPTVPLPGYVWVFRLDPVTGQFVQEGDRLEGNALQGDEARFGKSVGVDGEFLVVGSAYDDEFGTDVGAAYVFRHDSNPGNEPWELHRKLPPCDPLRVLHFGWSISIDGDSVLVGTRKRPLDEMFPACDVFRFEGADWVRIASLSEENGSELGFYGWGVAISGDRAAVTDFGFDGDEEDQGAAYPFVGLLEASPCACATDIDGNGTTDIDDVAAMLAQWGACPVNGCAECEADIDGTCSVDGDDLALLLEAWGPCLYPGSVMPPATIQDCLTEYGESPARLAACLELLIQ